MGNIVLLRKEHMKHTFCEFQQCYKGIAWIIKVNWDTRIDSQTVHITLCFNGMQALESAYFEL